jgi:hypothetical protein
MKGRATAGDEKFSGKTAKKGDFMQTSSRRV